jgi:hypothetical protein
VRDLEIALVLAREMKAAAERSVDASLRLDQLQEVFGVQELDSAERARIQTALQMAGLEPFPSLLEADPSEPIRFGAAKTAAVAGSATVPAPAPPPPPPAEEPPSTQAQPTFPTVGQFARSKLHSRRFGVRRGDHGEDDGPPPPVEPNGYPVDEAELEQAHEPEEVEEHGVADEYVEEEHEPEPEPEPEPEAEYDEEPAPGAHDYVPAQAPEPVSYEEPEAAGGRADVVAVLLPAVTIPVIVTSVVGWRFGLPFVALSVIAAGWVLSRERRGFRDGIRHSPGAGTALKVTGVVTVLSVAAAVALVAVRDSSSTSGKKAAAPAKQASRPPVASKPARNPATKKPATKKPATPAAKKHHHHKPATTPTTPTPTTRPAPAPDPATQGLILVPPSGGGSGAGTRTTP